MGESVSSWTNVTIANGSIVQEERLWGISPDHWSDIYHTAYNCEIFLFPLLIIVAAYIRIYMLLTRRSRQILTGPAASHSHHNENGEPSKKAPIGLPKRSVLKALKMSVIHVAFF